MAAVLPWLELTLGFCLALGRAVREAAVVAAALLVLFFGYAVTHSSEAGCGCFLFAAMIAVECARADGQP